MGHFLHWIIVHVQVAQSYFDLESKVLKMLIVELLLEVQPSRRVWKRCLNSILHLFQKENGPSRGSELAQYLSDYPWNMKLDWKRWTRNRESLVKGMSAIVFTVRHHWNWRGGKAWQCVSMSVQPFENKYWYKDIKRKVWVVLCFPPLFQHVKCFFDVQLCIVNEKFSTFLTFRRASSVEPVLHNVIA